MRQTHMRLSQEDRSTIEAIRSKVVQRRPSVMQKPSVQQFQLEF